MRIDPCRDAATAARPAGPSRRDVLAGGGAFTAALAVLSALGPAAQAQGAKPPNILYILADDLGWKDVGFHGSDIATPNLDGLAAGGARLEQFYVQPLCTPTRAALMTGRYPLRYGLQTGVIPSGGRYGLQTDEFLLPQALKQAGYRTALVGKWHLGHADTAFWPRQRGFDSFYGALVGEIDHFKHEAHGVTDWYRDNTLLHEEGYDTELFGAEAVRLIEAQDAGVPLFLYLAFTAPHTPFQAPQTYLDRYAHISDPQRRAYAAMITAMDDQIGKVIDALDRRGLRENTLVIFHSDNGGTRSKMFVGESAVEGDLPASNGPYRNGKGTLYEGGTRVVALANWPGRIKPGSSDGVMHIVDMLPTLAALAGADLGKAKPLDGMNVWPALGEGRPSPRSDVVYNIEPMQGTVREGDWKLHWLAALPPRMELFDLGKDPSEATDVAARHPDVVARLQQHVIDLARQMAPPLFFATALQATLSAPLATPSDAVYGAAGADD